MTGHGHEARVKNGPALAGHGAEAVRDAITRSIVTLPEELRQSLTWDQGAEMAQHARLKIDAGVQVYFCDPGRRGRHSPAGGAAVHQPEQAAEVIIGVDTHKDTHTAVALD